MKNEVQNYYMQLLGKEDQYCKGGDLSELKSLLSSKLTMKLKEFLVQAVLMKKIHAIVNSMPSSKSSRSEWILGYCGSFINSYNAGNFQDRSNIEAK